MNIFNRHSRSLAAVSVVSFVFSFTGPLTALAAGPAAVNLGSAGNYVILAKTGISTTGSTSVVGDLGLSPAAASYITGFALMLPAESAFATSSLVTGKVYAPGYADPTPANLTTAVLDMQTAYTDAAGRAATVTELGAGNIGGLTLAPGVYTWGTGVTIPTDVTLSGGANDVWIFQIAQTLTVSSGARVTLSGGAKAVNIFWQVAGQTTLGTTSVVNGNILGQTAIVLDTGARLNGRALAQTAVTLDSNTVTKPTTTSQSTPTPTPTSTPTPSSTPSGQSSGGSHSSTPTPTPTALGRVGTSANLTTYGLREGDVIGASAGDPDIFIVNAWGYKRLFLNPAIFAFYGHLGGFTTVKRIVPVGRDALPTSGLVRNCETGDQKVYAIEVTGEDTGTLHWVNLSGGQAAAQDATFFKRVFCINSREFNWYSTSATAYTSLSQIPVYQR